MSKDIHEQSESRQSTASDLRRDVALLKSMLADDAKKRTQTATKPKKSRQKTLRSKPMKLSSIREETTGDFSTGNVKIVTPDDDINNEGTTEQPLLLGPYEDETDIKKRKKKKKSQIREKKERIQKDAKKDVPKGKRDEDVGDDGEPSQSYRTSKEKRKKRARKDGEETEHAHDGQGTQEQCEQDDIERAITSGLRAAQQSPSEDELVPESRRSLENSKGDSDVSDLTSDSKAFERAMALKRPSVIERKAPLVTNTSDITIDPDAIQIAKQSIVESDKEAQLTGTRALWAEFDKWQSGGSWGTKRSGDSGNWAKWDAFSDELAQPKTKSISDADKWDPFNDASSQSDDNALIEKWKMCFESGYSSDTKELVAAMIDAKHKESAQRSASSAMFQSTANLRASAPAAVRGNQNMSCILPDVNTSSESPSRRSALALTAPMSSYRSQTENLAREDKRSHELLSRYIQSLGTELNVAREIARSFVQNQSEVDGDGATHGNAAHLDIPGSETGSIMDSRGDPVFIDTETTLQLGERRIREEYMARSPALGAAHGGSTSGIRRHRAIWPRFDRPGAVQMNTRAFGAPRRDIPVPREDIENGSSSQEASSREVVIEARAVSDDDHDSRVSRSTMPPVVYAEKLSFASWARQHPFFRGAMVILALVIAAVVAAVLGLSLTRDDSGNNASSGDSPSVAPTSISNEIIQVMASVSGYDVLSEEGSPQRRAIGWLTSVDQSGLEPTDSGLLQRYVLVVLYFATGGDQWIEREKWLAPELHECLWGAAITCKTEASNRQVVTGLDLSRQGLKGRLPPEVGYLTQVEQFSVSRNALDGTLPASVFNMTRLAFFDIHSNEFSGKLPSTISNARYIVDLDLSKNLFSGTIPEALYDLSILRTLDVSVNQLTGVLASGLGKLRVLTNFNIRSNLITGSIPDTFDVLTNLGVVNLDNNLLTGNIPEWTAVLVQRQELTVSFNLLTGTIPGAPEGGLAALGGVTPESYRLSKVDLSSNRLQGTIPVEVAFIPSLRYIDFSNNRQLRGTFPSFPGVGLWRSIEYIAASNCQLTGTVPSAFGPTLVHYQFHGNSLVGGFPAELCDLPELEYISLSFNDIGGQLPEAIGSMKRLEALDLRACSLVGTIPKFASGSLASLDLAENSLGGSLMTEMGLLSTLTEFIVHSNRLTGTLPTELGDLTNLVSFDVRDNFMNGKLPTELARLSDLDQFLVANNYFQGSIPEGICLLVDDLRFVDVGCQLECSCCSDEAGVCATSDGSRAPQNNLTNMS